MKTIDATQIKLIHIAKSKLQLSDQEYRDLIVRFTPTSFDIDPDKPSCKGMTYQEAHDLIEHLKTRGFELVPKRREEAQRKPYNWEKKPQPGHYPKQREEMDIPKLPTAWQIGMIECLRDDCVWHVADGFRRWLEKYLGRQLEEGKAWRTLVHTSKEAQYVIEALKGMKGRQARTAAAKADTGEQMHDTAMIGGKAKW